MDRREKIRDLIFSLNSLSFDEDRRLDDYLVKAGVVIRELFGDFNAYLTCLNYIRFYPVFPSASPQDNVRHWAKAKKEMRDLLYVMLEDPRLVPHEPSRARVMSKFADEETVPRYDMEALAQSLEEFQQRIREDIHKAERLNQESIQNRQQVEPPQVSQGPKQIEKIRIDLRDLFILERNDDPVVKSASLPGEFTKKIFFLPGSNNRINDDIMAEIGKAEATLCEGKPLGGHMSLQEQLAHHPQLTTAVVVLNDDCLFQLRSHGLESAFGGPQLSNAFALGYLIGKLGRKNVVAIYTDVERFKRPTSFFEAIYIAYDAVGAWKKELGKYFSENGIKVKTSGRRFEGLL